MSVTDTKVHVLSMFHTTWGTNQRCFSPRWASVLIQLYYFEHQFHENRDFCLFYSPVTPLSKRVPVVQLVLNKYWPNENYLVNLPYASNQSFQFCEEAVHYGVKGLDLETNQPEFVSGLHPFLPVILDKLVSLPEPYFSPAETIWVAFQLQLTHFLVIGPLSFIYFLRWGFYIL